MKPSNQTCPHCGQSMTPRWESINKGLVQTLVIFARAVAAQGKNAVLVNKQADLTHNQKANFQKLRYHGLVEMNDDRDGTWSLTYFGHQFLAGDLRIPKKVLVFDKRVLDRADDTVTIQDVMGNAAAPYWHTREDYINAMDRFFNPDKRDLFHDCARQAR